MIQGSVDQVLDLPSRALPSALPSLLAQVELEQTLPLAWPRLAISRPQGSALPAVIVKLPRHPGQQDAQPASVLSAAVVRKDFSETHVKSRAVAVSSRSRGHFFQRLDLERHRQVQKKAVTITHKHDRLFDGASPFDSDLDRPSRDRSDDADPIRVPGGAFSQRMVAFSRRQNTRPVLAVYRQVATKLAHRGTHFCTQGSCVSDTSLNGLRKSRRLGHSSVKHVEEHPAGRLQQAGDIVLLRSGQSLIKRLAAQLLQSASG